MVYISGDNDLEPAVIKDLEKELAQPGSSPQVQVLALADRSPSNTTRPGNWSDTRLYHVTRGLKATAANALGAWGERNMGDPHTLLQFVTWAKTHYPAKRYALFLWGHGWNWRPGYTLEDQTDQDALDPHEIQGILSDLGPLDLVAYDGCSMGSIEVDALWYGHAQAIVHSQEYVDWEGLAYDRILTALQARPHMDALALAKVVNQSARNSSERTGSAVVLDARFRHVLQALDLWSEALIQGLPQYHTAYQQAIRQAAHFSETPEDYDLWDLVTQILHRVPDPHIQARGQALLSALKGAIIDEWHQPPYPFAHGLSISWVGPTDPHAPYYQSLDLVRYSRWSTFLQAYQAMTSADPHSSQKAPESSAASN
jgi:hypothetical protein